MKGRVSPTLGFKRSESSNQQTSRTLIQAHKLDPTISQRKSKNNGKYWLGKERKNLHSFETKQRLSLLHRGKKSPLYIDGRTNLVSSIRGLLEYREWRNRVFKRDNYTCKRCPNREHLEAHHRNSFSSLVTSFLQRYSHLDPTIDIFLLVELARKYKPFWNIRNGETLCENCHKKTDTYLRKICQTK